MINGLYSVDCAEKRVKRQASERELSSIEEFEDAQYKNVVGRYSTSLKESGSWVEQAHN